MNVPIALLILAAVVAYLVSCAVWPYAPCRHCGGGKQRAPKGRVWRDCRWCGGRGRRVRLGRRLFEGWRKH